MNRTLLVAGFLAALLLGVACDRVDEPRCTSACTTLDVCGVLPPRLGKDRKDCTRQCDAVDTPERDPVFDCVADGLDTFDRKLCVDAAQCLARAKLLERNYALVHARLVTPEDYADLTRELPAHLLCEITGCEDGPTLCDPAACPNEDGSDPLPTPECPEFAGLEVELGLRPLGGDKLWQERVPCTKATALGVFLAPDLTTVRAYARFHGGDGDSAFCHHVDGRIIDLAPGSGLVVLPMPDLQTLLDQQAAMATCEPLQAEE